MSEPGVLISIITPCYNHGQYLDEAIESIQSIKTPYTYEHIIINDGSTDDFTIQKLQQLQANGHTVIHQKNLGLATARNNAIAIAKGKYIIPLDADNKLHQNYLTKAIDILERDETIDVVYGDNILFGEKNRINKVQQFNPEKLLCENYIDACAVIRKKTLEAAGGYDTNMPVMGAEDWELWIAIFFNKGKFYPLGDAGFYYRIRSNSMVVTITHPGLETNYAYILQKYARQLLAFYGKSATEKLRLEKQVAYINYLKKNKLKLFAKLLTGFKI